MDRKNFIQSLVLGTIAVPTGLMTKKSVIKPDLKDVLDKASKLHPGTLFTHEHFTELTKEPDGTGATWIPILVVDGNSVEKLLCRLHRKEKVAYDTGSHIRMPMFCFSPDGKVMSRKDEKQGAQRGRLSSTNVRKGILENIEHAWEGTGKDNKFIVIVTCARYSEGIGICCNSKPLIKYSNPVTVKDLSGC